MPRKRGRTRSYPGNQMIVSTREKNNPRPKYYTETPTACVRCGGRVFPSGYEADELTCLSCGEYMYVREIPTLKPGLRT
jgi:hypothetical protein